MSFGKVMGVEILDSPAAASCGSPAALSYVSFALDVGIGEASPSRSLTSSATVSTGTMFTCDGSFDALLLAPVATLG